MPQKTYRPEEIIAKLRQADVLLGGGKKVAEVVKALGTHEVTYYRWRRGSGGLSLSQASPFRPTFTWTTMMRCCRMLRAP